MLAEGLEHTEYEGAVRTPAAEDVPCVLANP